MTGTINCNKMDLGTLNCSLKANYCVCSKYYHSVNMIRKFPFSKDSLALLLNTIKRFVFLTNEFVKICNYNLKNTHFSITWQPFTSTMYYKE